MYRYIPDEFVRQLTGAGLDLRKLDDAFGLLGFNKVTVRNELTFSSVARLQSIISSAEDVATAIATAGLVNLSSSDYVRRLTLVCPLDEHNLKVYKNGKP